MAHAVAASSTVRWSELLSGAVFFAGLLWMIAEVLVSVPRSAPSLLPLLPMTFGILWYVGIESWVAWRPVGCPEEHH